MRAMPAETRASVRHNGSLDCGEGINLSDEVFELGKTIGRPSRLVSSAHDCNNKLGRMVGSCHEAAPGEVLVGVAMAQERPNGRLGGISSEVRHGLVLGVALLPNITMTVEQLRRDLVSQVISLPGCFTFLTTDGWPIQRHQESSLKASHVISDSNVITIKRLYDRPKVGIGTTNGDCLGFIFANFSWTLQQVREAINEQLYEAQKPTKLEYKFLEPSGWPVTLAQESLLTLLDVLIGQNLCIQYGNPLQSVPSNPQPVPALPAPSTKPALTLNPQHDVMDGDWEVPRKKRPLSKQDPIRETMISIRRRPTRDPDPRSRSSKGLVAKPILISYVRAEAAQHALDLKICLGSLGFSVYLDVHEIKFGDWQDALNYAVSNCLVFVPLVTPMYGKTLWTNREVKLADVLSKVIIPINFTDCWPPECLAIQFAATQYIPYKLQDNNDHVKPETPDKILDYRGWEPLYIKRVSKEIAERCKATFKLEKELQKLKLSDTKSYRSGSIRQLKSISFSPAAAPTPSEEFPMGPIQEENNEGKQLIVISAHPKQKDLVNELTTTFQGDGYDVWCSTELEVAEQLTEVDSSPTNPNTPRDLPTIPEGETIFSQVYKEIANNIAENKRVLSVMKSDADYTERRPLTRLISQVSDISQVSSLTPDKMEKLKVFQRKVDSSGIVIILVSEAYTKSMCSQQQVFYCEHRKQIVLVKCDNFTVPSWFSMLMGNDMISHMSNPQFITAMKSRVKRAMNPASYETPKDATMEAKMQCLVSFMKKNLPLVDTCVYIAGSSKLQSPRSEEICRAIGRELAKITNVTVVTGGFFGAPEIVAKTFYEARKNNIQGCTFEEEPVVHVLPIEDTTQDFNSKARQNPDGSFEPAPYGRSLFLGNSVKERETAVARIFDTCIVIEGGPGAAHEVEEFIWNDHFVIPVISTGGAASGQYGVPLKIFETPPCTSETDWAVLSEKEATPDEVAMAVIHIVRDIKQAIASHSEGKTEAPNLALKGKSKSRSKSKRAKERSQGIDNKALEPSQPNLTLALPIASAPLETPEPSFLTVEHQLSIEAPSEDGTPSCVPKNGRWHRMLRYLIPKRTC